LKTNKETQVLIGIGIVSYRIDTLPESIEYRIELKILVSPIPNYTKTKNSKSKGAAIGRGATGTLCPGPHLVRGPWLHC